MVDKIKFLVLFICITIFAGIEMYYDSKAATNFEAEGVVVQAKWNTSNHQMSLFLIEEKSDTKKFHFYDVILKPQHIKVGDKFQNKSGSKICLINDIKVRCVK